MSIFTNLDLFSTGIAIAGIVILGIVIFLNNRGSVTNRAFFYFSLAATTWSIFNYISYQASSQTIVLWLLRCVMFSAVWYSFCLFQLFYVFPNKEITFPSWYRFFIIPIVFITSVIALTPLVFSGIKELASPGEVSTTTPGVGIFLFGVVVIGLIGGGVIKLIIEMKKAPVIKKIHYRLILIGAAITFFLHIVFNFILAAFFDNPRFIPLGAVFTFPFIVFTAYAIIKHGLLNVKIIATEILTFVLAVTVLIEVILAENFGQLLFRVGIFSLVLTFGVLLIRGVRREVEQRERLEVLTKELQAANERLKELDKLKSEFLSFASHQLKAPMAVVKGFATLIYEGTYGKVPMKVKETAARIKESADRLINLVNNFLDLRRIEEGKMEYNFADVDLIDLVKSIVEELKIMGKLKKLELSFSTPLKEVKVKADENKLRQVIYNLVENSVKYTDAGWVKAELKEQLTTNNSPLTTGSDQQQKEIVITVSDSGRGMSAELVPELFKQFSRDAKAAKAIQGTGLGLFIAQQIVTAHNGKIWAESDGEGKGSRFLVKLPLA